jgi:ATP-dependent Clp protease ATP-binding subunit ClpB
MDKLTSKFQLALADAQSMALGKDHQFIEPIHVMLALIDQEGGSIRPLLMQTGVQVNAVRNELVQEVGRLATVSGSGGDVQISNQLLQMLNLTDKLAQKRQDAFISSELFLLAALEGKSTLQGILIRAGVTKQAIEKAIENMRGGQNVNDANAEDQRQALKKYTINLTERAEQGKLDPVIGPKTK